MISFLKEWLYYLVDKDGKSYRVNNGSVETTGTITPLPESPAGWTEKVIKWGRSMKYYGMVRSYTTPLKFVTDGARILRHLFFAAGFETTVFLLIQKIDKRFNQGMVHKLFYKGEIDLSKFISSPDTVTVNILEGGLDALIKANENTVYDIDMYDSRAVILEHDGIKLETKGVFSLLDGVEIGNDVYGVQYMVPFLNTGTEGQAFGITYKQQSPEAIPGPLYDDQIEYIQESDNWAARNDSPDPITVKIAGKAIVKTAQNDVNGGYTLRWMTSTQNSGNQDIYNFTGVATAGAPGTIQEFPDSREIILQPGEKLYLRGGLIFPTGAVRLAIEFEVGSEFTFTIVTRKPITRIQAFTPMGLGQILLEKMCGPGYTLSSSILSTDWNGLLTTSGDALRGFENAKMKTSWNEFWKSYNSVINLEMDIRDNVVRIEPKQAAFGGSVAASLGRMTVEDGKGFKLATDFIFNTVKVGYPNSQVQDANGRFEVNTTHRYTTSVVKVVKELDLISDYSASIYDQEYTRINFENKQSTNSDTDSTVFFIHCNNTPVLDDSALFFKYIIRRDTYDSITGVFDPASVYNVEISPKRNLLRHGNYIRACLYFQQTTSLVFQGSDKNADLETVTDATVISPEIRIKESADVRISSLDSPLFIPVEFTGESPSPYGISDIMEATPNERFSFIYRDVTYYGYPLEISVQPANKAPQESRLLLSTNNNLIPLIHG